MLHLKRLDVKILSSCENSPPKVAQHHCNIQKTLWLGIKLFGCRIAVFPTVIYMFVSHLTGSSSCGLRTFNSSVWWREEAVVSVWRIPGCRRPCSPAEGSVDLHTDMRTWIIMPHIVSVRMSSHYIIQWPLADNETQSFKTQTDGKCDREVMKMTIRNKLKLALCHHCWQLERKTALKELF